jgi:hypothetical protein
VPAVEKVRVYFPPGAIVPLSKLLSSAVTVWFILSLFVQVMVAPAVAVRDAAENCIPDILTAFPVAGGVVAELDAPLSLLEQDRTEMAMIISITSDFARIFFERLVIRGSLVFARLRQILFKMLKTAVPLGGDIIIVTARAAGQKYFLKSGYILKSWVYQY